MSNNVQKLEEEIESDNELPSDYVDIPDIPAYKNDIRFETVKFPWINKFKDKKVQNQTMPITLYSTLNEKTVQERMQNNKENKLLVTKGVLNEQDIFCLKSIETLHCDGTLLWLINFFMYKDLQEDYKFLRTCLVEKNICSKIKNDNNKPSQNYATKTHQFEIVALQKKYSV